MVQVRAGSILGMLCAAACGGKTQELGSVSVADGGAVSTDPASMASGGGDADPGASLSRGSGGDTPLTGGISMPESTDTATGDQGTGGEPTAEPWGSFTLNLLAGTPETDFHAATPASTTFKGRVFDRKFAPGVPMTVQQQAGDCQLLTPALPVCAPACSGTSTCTVAGTCVPAPNSKSVGTVMVRGVRTQAGLDLFTLEPVGDLKVYQGTDLAYPPCFEGESVGIEVAGEDYSGFSVATTCIRPLVVRSGAEVPLAPDQPSTLTWDPPAAVGVSHVKLTLDVSHYRGLLGLVECEAPDTGSLTVPATLITELIELGYAGYPSLTLTRVSTQTVAVATGSVELRVVSSVTLPVTIPGLTSCIEDEMCPSGQVCNVIMSCENV